MLYEAFLDFLNSENKLDLTQKLSVWLQKILGISNFGLYFIENDMFSIYKLSGDKELFTYPLSQGIAGYILQNAKPCIISDVKSSIFYDKSIDICSQLPLLGIPLTEFHFYFYYYFIF